MMNEAPTFADVCRERTRQLRTIDWTSPVVLVGVAAALTLPMIGGYFIGMGLFTGLIMALVILLIVNKLPRWFKKQCVKHPLLADVLLTGLALGTVGKLLGGGLILGVGGLVCGIILSVALYFVDREAYQPQTVTA